MFPSKLGMPHCIAVCLVSIEKRDQIAGLGDDGSESLFDEFIGAGTDDAGHRAGHRPDTSTEVAPRKDSGQDTRPGAKIVGRAPDCARVGWSLVSPPGYGGKHG